jgi:hypothetical protein
MAKATSVKSAPAKPAPAKAAAAKPDILPEQTAAKRALDPQVRLRMIAEAAYYIAEKRGFIHGHHDADWAAAEQQVDRMLAGN